MARLLPQRLSLWVLCLIILVWTFRSFSIAAWKGDELSDRLIYHDVINYYAYLPATFIKGDPTLSFLGEGKVRDEGLYWHERTEDGERVIKTTMGLAYLYAPFFFLAHGFATITGFDANGFSIPYQLALAMSALFYASLGLLLLRSILRSFYGELVTSLTLISVALATNLYYYVVDESAMSHSYNFALFAAFFYTVMKLFSGPSLRNFLTMGLLGGVIFMIRPSNAVVLLSFPLLYGVSRVNDLSERTHFLLRHAKGVGLALLGAFLVLIPQFLYWKGVTGDWIYYSYQEEGFFFGDPKFWDVLFSYRSGWLVYTPIMFLALPGLFLFGRDLYKRFFWAILILLFLKLYLMASWWCWWFGGSFGCRPIIDIYAFLALPLAASFHFLRDRIWLVQGASLLVLAFLIHVNLYQSWQYKATIIHWDGMTREAYWHVFLRNDHPPEEAIERPDYEAALKGKRD